MAASTENSAGFVNVKWTYLSNEIVPKMWTMELQVSIAVNVLFEMYMQKQRYYMPFDKIYT